jgi:uracil-DNA glycosylase
MSDLDELSTLLRDLRTTLGRHARAGTWAASASASAVSRVDALDVIDSPLLALRQQLGDCQRCGLCSTRNQIVFGNGNDNAALMFVGEGPGADEDRTGLPFVGKAGELLDKMIAAMGWQRSEVYIANVVKCRPPQNRTPTAQEIATCRPFLVGQLAAVKPRVVVALGRPAANVLLDNDAPISSLRGRFFDCAMGGHSFRLMPTFHPAYLLRSPEHKREAWSDLQAVMAELQRLNSVPAGS